MRDGEYILQTQDLSKSFPGVHALSGFDFQLGYGEIHGLLGENGAGKSTFIKLLNGLYAPERGSISVENRKIERPDPILVNQMGVKFVHQDLSVFPYLSIVENICMNNYPRTRLGTIDWKKGRDFTSALLAEYNLDIDPDTKIFRLSIGQRQLIEIISNVSQNARVVVLDEPTASLGDSEKNKLFEVMRSLKARGISVIFISHILEEVLSICDMITVIRDGRKVGTWENRDLTKEFLIEKIVGERIEEIGGEHGEAEAQAQGETALELSEVSYKHFFQRVSLKVPFGQIVGILGLLGSGKTEIADLCFGLCKPSSGHIAINGKQVGRLTPLAAIRSGVGYVTEDRYRNGVFRFLSVTRNCSMAVLERLRGVLGIVNRSYEASLVSRAVNSLDIRIASPAQEIRQLSGGNQQKVLLGRWLLADQKILILDEPTKGVDVGARNEFYRILRALKKEHRAIIVLTSDHREALAISDRLFLLKGGKLIEYQGLHGATARDVLSRLTGD